MSSVFGSLDLGGTNIKGAFGTTEGRIIHSVSIPTESHAGPEVVLNRMAALVGDLAEYSGETPEAVGIGVPGLLDLERGVARFLPNFPSQWHNVAVSSHLAPRLGCPVYLLNDVRMATLGELTFGHGRDFPNLVFFSLGTGIGGGVVVDGKLRLGPMGAAGEVGHQTILADGPVCGCGNRGCLETLASGPALTAAGVRLLRSGMAPELYRLTHGDVGRVNPQTMAAASEAGDTNIRQALVDAAEKLGIGIANVITILHPDVIILGGGVAQIGELLFETVRETVMQRVGMFPPDDIKIVPSMLGEKAGTLGGIALAMQGGLVSQEKE